MFKSLMKGLLFDFDRLSYVISQTYDETTSIYDNKELFNFTLQSQNRYDEICNFLNSTFGSDYYTKELISELNALLQNADMHSMGIESLQSFTGKETAIRWNLFTATFDYVRQFLEDDGVDSAFFQKLYKTTLKKYNLNPLVML
tara:strand:- start:235 stop:666 length:432 start_codon:yes stop_codon:yes gene_type:complete